MLWVRYKVHARYGRGRHGTRNLKKSKSMEIWGVESESGRGVSMDKRAILVYASGRNGGRGWKRCEERDTGGTWNAVQRTYSERGHFNFREDSSTERCTGIVVGMIQDGMRCWWERGSDFWILIFCEEWGKWYIWTKEGMGEDKSMSRSGYGGFESCLTNFREGEDLYGRR
jgi:hypothetical protein